MEISLQEELGDDVVRETWVIRLQSNRSNGDWEAKVCGIKRIGNGGFAGGRYFPHCLWSYGSFHINPCDAIELRRVASATDGKLLSPRVNDRGSSREQGLELPSDRAMDGRMARNVHEV